MTQLPRCPQCDGLYIYEENGNFICPECAYEWPQKNDEEFPVSFEVYDVNGQLLTNGDSVIVIKDLRVKGSSSVLKSGTKVKNIRLVDGNHNIDCKIPGIGQMVLKSEFVKKV
ncbi:MULTISPECIES: zinc ribbon domain-containing protein YjdM [unclassified Bartonella]|uniref:zinc ribbon domain-containing protein YjdM n=1 Tax=unclassified Bartonella TaxID=2645622 RepID=UPI00099A43E0|nr:MULTISPECIES: zinc ribbon domain-containing protein YjdM [unclassified Bartonella]AQX28384.1 phosphonoacetate hydrolase [Bartonella sp. JB15]AQX29651.1 phosphonoacetate hydrolase [Bartonella sp. JB63]